jgi:hypothetical protein
MKNPLVLVFLFSVLSLPTNLFADMYFREAIQVSYDPFLLGETNPRPKRLIFYKKTRSLCSSKSGAIVRKRWGASYWTGTLAPIVLDSLYANFVPRSSGELVAREASSVADSTADRLLISGKNRLRKFSNRHLPALPLIGDLVGDFVQSQKVSFTRGTPHCRELRLQKRIARGLRLGIYGKRVRVDLNSKLVDLRVDWNPGVIRFHLNLRCASL